MCRVSAEHGAGAAVASACECPGTEDRFCDGSACHCCGGQFREQPAGFDGSQFGQQFHAVGWAGDGHDWIVCRAAWRIVGDVPPLMEAGDVQNSPCCWPWPRSMRPSVRCGSVLSPGVSSVPGGSHERRVSVSPKP